MPEALPKTSQYCMDQKLQNILSQLCHRWIFNNAVSLYETLKRNTILNLAVFELLF